MAVDAIRIFSYFLGGDHDISKIRISLKFGYLFKMEYVCVSFFLLFQNKV